MEPIIFTGKVGNISIEDSGCAQIADLDDLESSADDQSFFVRLQSWSDDIDDTDKPLHPTMDSLKGKKVRITVEVLDEVDEDEV